MTRSHSSALGSSFGEPLWGAALASFPEQLGGTIALKNSSFGEQLSLWGAVLGYRFEESQLWGNSFGQQLWGTILGSNFGDHVQSLERISLLMDCENPGVLKSP